ncbi:MAG: cadherin-like beta sandwich domain-containing protein [Agathobacter sp.]
MKKIVKYLAMVCLALGMLIGMNNAVLAANASLTASSSTVRAGDTITLSFKVPHQGSHGVTGTLEYDSNQVTLSGEPTTSLSGWMVERNGNELAIYDNNLENPLKGTETVITLKFKVNSNVAEGTKLNIAIKNIVSSDGSADTNIGTATYSVTIARPLSTNANLGSLSVTGLTLSPDFKAGTTTYNLGEVEYSVKALDIKCSTEDSNATYTIKNNSLMVGENTVSIVVTAENGTQKTYKLKVTRKQDPNYVAGSNANLKALKVSQGTLSPVFSANVTDYIVYLPYECVGTSFTASGTEADSKAQGVISGTIDKLVEGKNQTVVVCKAEDGTEKTYAVVVYVMPKYEGNVPNIGGATGGNDNPGTVDPGTNPGETEEPGTSTEDPSENPTETPTEEPGTSETPSESEDSPTDNKSDNGVLVSILVILVVIVLVGALIYVLFFFKKI